MKKALAGSLLLVAMLLGLPLIGALLEGLPLTRYLEFPPRILYVQHAPFSWGVFVAYSLLIAGCMGPFLRRGLKHTKGKEGPLPRAFRFPWWGWLGLFLGLVSWILAWNRFPWFAPLQPHTFTPLWLAYILVINALAYRRSGLCPLVDRPSSYLLLFPVSALFWWFFEYLNRFVQNWYYIGPPFGPWEYCLYATLPFSTVLPAITATREWLLTYPFFKERFTDFLPFSLPHPRIMAILTLLLAGAGLMGIGVWPDHLFSLLWVSPLLILVSFQALSKETHLFSAVSRGDWRLIVVSCLAALMCGFFWEMWNFYSLAKWRYQIPFVHRFQIFEMPILGYVGYLPFGLECAVIIEWFLGFKSKEKRSFQVYQERGIRK